MVVGKIFRIPGLVIGSLLYCAATVIALSGQQVMHYWWAFILLGVGWNFLFISGTTLLPQTYLPSERFKVQAKKDFIILGIQAVASLSLLVSCCFNLAGIH